MSWKLRLLTLEPSEIEREAPHIVKCGDMWFAPWMLDDVGIRSTLSRHYWDSRPERPPLMIAMPFGWRFSPDRMAYDGKVHSGGWKVSGDFPDITINPSINLVEAYHGWIQQGVISDDCEGRLYSADGHSLNNG